MGVGSIGQLAYSLKIPVITLNVASLTWQSWVWCLAEILQGRMALSVLQPFRGPSSDYLSLHLHLFSTSRICHSRLVTSTRLPPWLFMSRIYSDHVCVSADISGGFREWEKVNVCVPNIFNQRSHVALQMSQSGPGMLQQLTKFRFGTYWHFTWK